jgi:hypothetical protein
MLEACEESNLLCSRKGQPVGQNPRNTMHFREIFYRTVNTCTSLVLVMG